MNKKYELTNETQVFFGRTLYRIRALISFGNVKAGDLGGWIEKEENLAQDGDAWVSGDARVYGNAWVERCTHYLLIGAIGSRADFTTFMRSKDRKIIVACGCFRGTIDEFEAKVKETHGDSKHAKAYMAAIELAKIQIDDVEV